MQLLSTSSDCQRHLSFVSWFTVAVRPVYSVRNLRFSVAASSAIHINLNIHDSTCGKLLRPTERNDNWLSASENKETNSSDRSEQQKKSNDETTVARALQSTVVSTYFKWKMNTHWSVKLKINWLIRVPPEGLDQQNRLILLNAFRLIELLFSFRSSEKWNKSIRVTEWAGEADWFTICTLFTTRKTTNFIFGARCSIVHLSPSLFPNNCCLSYDRYLLSSTSITGPQPSVIGRLEPCATWFTVQNDLLTFKSILTEFLCFECTCRDFG